MGMFDYVHITHPDITPVMPKGSWQTKDTPDQWLTLYDLGPDGILRKDGAQVDIDGVVSVYTYTDASNKAGSWVEWNLHFLVGEMILFTLVEGED